MNVFSAVVVIILLGVSVRHLKCGVEQEAGEERFNALDISLMYFELIIPILALVLVSLLNDAVATCLAILLMATICLNYVFLWKGNCSLLLAYALVIFAVMLSVFVFYKDTNLGDPVVYFKTIPAVIAVAAMIIANYWAGIDTNREARAARKEKIKEIGFWVMLLIGGVAVGWSFFKAIIYFAAK